MYEWSAVELGEPRLLDLVRDGNPVYAWPFEERRVWRSARMPAVGRALERATRARLVGRELAADLVAIERLAARKIRHERQDVEDAV